jgi:8-oxo-dGTP pyrophosphatase MutT (NUDIX family)
MLERPASRLLVLDETDRLLLFRFEPKQGAMVGQSFWATPGGGVEPGESFEAAACREAFEEIGLHLNDPGPQTAQRSSQFALFDGTMVSADERYFLIRVYDLKLTNENWTALEHEVMAAHHWWSQHELRSARDQIWPETLEEMLITAGAWKPVA